MRENVPNNMAYWARDEEPKHKDKISVSQKPLMIDKAQDTSLDEESFKLVSCKCRLFDSNTSIDEYVTNLEQKSGSSLVECQCFQEKQKTFLDAVFTGNFELLELCLEEDVDFNAVDENGDTALHMVSDRGDIDMLNYLLKTKDVNINMQNYGGFTPLSVAIIAAHDESAKLLLENGADPNIAANNGRTPLSFSVSAGNVKMTRLLIEYGADVNAMDAFGNTPLSTALVEHPLLILVQVLLSYGANPLQQNNRLNPFLETVLGCTNAEKMQMVVVLVEWGVDVNVIEIHSGRNCLHLNGINGFLPLAEYLVNSGANLELLDMSKRNPYQVAMEHNNCEVADFFLKAMLLRRIINKKRLQKKATSIRRLTMTHMFRNK